MGSSSDCSSSDIEKSDVTQKISSSQEVDPPVAPHRGMQSQAEEEFMVVGSMQTTYMTSRVDSPVAPHRGMQSQAEMELPRNELNFIQVSEMAPMMELPMNELDSMQVYEMAPMLDELVAPHPATRTQAEVIENRGCIYRVPHRLREVNEKAYEPNVVSIGPYHCGKPHLKAMQVIKHSFFWKIAEENNLNVDELKRTVRSLEARIRKCYEEAPFYLNSNQLVEMMLLDGCFIVQLIQGIHPVEDIFEVGRIQTDILHDLLLLENQLPFFVLSELYGMMVPNAGGDVRHLAGSALSFFKMSHRPLPKTNIMHLLDLVHSCQQPSLLGVKQHELFKAKAAAAAEPNSQRSWKFIRSATELEGAGISFFGYHIEKMIDHTQGIGTMFDIMFTEDTKELKIPTLQVDDRTESSFRNYMAYEQFLPRGKPTYFVDYVVFMDNLINTGKDVQLLCESGVIDNWLGDDEAVALMFNKLRDSIYMTQDFYYAEIFGRVNEHCQRKWNKWKAALKKNYFNTPWSLISFLAALVLLLLTLLQTIFSVLSYVKQ